MVFSSPLFLFLFLPIVLGLYLLLRRELRNPLLLLASLFFYFWGEQVYILLMLVSIAVNYVFGLLLARRRGRRGARLVLGCAVAANLGLLFFYKYANFIVDNLNHVPAWRGLAAFEWQPVHLPIGISFFTFLNSVFIFDLTKPLIQSL